MPCLDYFKLPEANVASLASSPAADHIGRALGVDRTLGPIWTIGGQEGAQISQPGVAVLGLQPSDAEKACAGIGCIRPSR
jgi:hypothetical protein